MGNNIKPHIKNYSAKCETSVQNIKPLNVKNNVRGKMYDCDSNRKYSHDIRVF